MDAYQGAGPATPRQKGLREETPADVCRGEDRSREPRRETRPGQNAAEIDQLKQRLLELEGDVRSEGSRAFDASAFAGALEKQAKVMTEALTVRARDPRSR